MCVHPFVARRSWPTVAPMVRPALVFALCSLVACRRAAPDASRPDASPAHPTARWVGDAPSAAPLRVDDSRWIVGALRRTATALAAPPYPARPLVAAARVGPRWRFASDDGTVFESEDFLGALTRVGTFPARARGADADGLHRAVAHLGALAWLDASGRAWTHDGRSPTALPLARVLDVLAASATRVYAITEPGALHRSDDGGAHFTAVPLADGEAALALSLDGDRAVLATSSRTVLLDDGGLPGATHASTVFAAAAAPPALPSPTPRTLPDDPSRVASLGGARLAVVEGSTLRVVDANAPRDAPSRALPGDACALYAGHGTARAVCTHDGWARAVWADDARGGWRLLRDELRAEPLGTLAFDDASDAWVVAAPCTQQPQIDAAALCAYFADGTRHAVHAPFDAVVVDAHDGATLVVAARGAPSLTQAVVLRGEAMTALSLPVSADEARGARFHGDAVSVWGRSAEGRPVLHRAVVGRERIGRWSHEAAPVGAVRGAVSHQRVLVWGDDAAHVWQRNGDGRFVPVAPAVLGDAHALSFSSDDVAYCAGPTCRVGALEVTPDVPGVPWFLTRDDSPGPVVTPWVAPPARPDARPVFLCDAGDTLGPGPELDHGIAVSGYALHWALSGTTLSVRWDGTTVRGATRAPWPGEGAVSGAAPVGATSPIALFSRGSGASVARRYATSRGVVDVALAAPDTPWRTDLVMASQGRVMALARGTSHGRAITFAALLDASTGRALASRAVASAGPASRVLPGEVDGRDGLWLPVDATRWRFLALDGDAPEVTVDDPGTARPCPAAGDGRLVLRRLDGYSELRGEGWAPIADEWQVEERLERVNGALCVRSIAGGESRDESAFERHGPETDLVRSFSLTSDGAEHLAGDAWQGRRRFAMRCTRVERTTRR